MAFCKISEIFTHFVVSNFGKALKNIFMEVILVSSRIPTEITARLSIDYFPDLLNPNNLVHLKVFHL